MNPKSLLAALLAGAVVAGAVLAPPSSNGQAARPAAAPAVAAEDPALTALLTDVVAQQAMIAENQAQIDTKLATVSETLRLARIYVGRGGGKVP